MGDFIFLPLAILASVGAIYCFARATLFRRGCVKTRGTVVELIEIPDSEGANTFTPRVVFITTAGEEVVFRTLSSQYPPSHKVGDVVTVWYRPDDAQNARIAKEAFDEGAGWTYALVALGLLVMWARLHFFPLLLTDGGGNAF